MVECRQQLERLIEVGRLAEARVLLQQSLASAPYDADAHVFGARIALEEKNLATAREHVREALAIDPRHFGARLLRYGLLLDEGRFGEAESAVLELLREDPSDADLLALYAKLMLYTANVAKAKALVAEALRREPDHRGARTVAVLAATIAGDRRAASEQLADLVRQDPECRITTRTLYSVLVDQRRYRQALLVGQQLLRAEPDDRDLIDAVTELRTHTHWLALPAWPLTRWGWGGAAALWVGAIVALTVLRQISPRWAVVFAVAYGGYAIYSWTYPSLLKRWIRWRGV